VDVAALAERSGERKRNVVSSALPARRAVVLVIALVSLVAVAALGGYPVYVSPRAGPLPSEQEPADAAVALGGMPESGASAWQLFQQGRVRHLVLSNPYERSTRNTVTGLCATKSGRRSQARTQASTVTCFAPDPATTRGEAREIARLAQANHWHHVVVVAPVFHLSRARMIIERCYRGDLTMIAAQASIPIQLWVYQYAYQTAGFAKAFTQQGC
jgi:uncharacterized SAM-binding protein YcdF (DUF218 family)